LYSVVGLAGLLGRLTSFFFGFFFSRPRASRLPMIDSLLPTINGLFLTKAILPRSTSTQELAAANDLRKSTFISVLFASGLLRAGSKGEQRQSQSA
jgi:hypothetical protein